MMQAFMTTLKQPIAMNAFDADARAARSSYFLFIASISR